MHPTSLDKIGPQWCLPPIQDAWFLTGPTASGKTEVSLQMAERLNAEIISMDSMAVYQDMDIGTAKPSLQQRERVRHHLIDVVTPTDDYSLGQYVQAALEIAADIRQRGREVLFVGGTTLYMKSLLFGMFLGPEPDLEFRAAVEADVEQYGIEALRKRLESVDPLSAFKILTNDKRRMIRALEVAKATGRPISHWQTQFDRVSKDRFEKVFALGWLRADLHSRVEQRVALMFEQGLLSEVEQLLKKYKQLGRTASQAVGYKEPIAFLNGKLSRSELEEQVVFHSRQFVRRQEIWLRSMPQIQRIEIRNANDLPMAAEQILNHAGILSA